MHWAQLAPVVWHDSELGGLGMLGVGCQLWVGLCVCVLVSLLSLHSC